MLGRQARQSPALLGNLPLTAHRCALEMASAADSDQ
jgi:hypothetical protein